MSRFEAIPSSIPEPQPPLSGAHRPRQGWAAVLVVALLAGSASGGLVAQLIRPSASKAPTTATSTSTTTNLSQAPQGFQFADLPALIAKVEDSVATIDVTSTSYGYLGEPLTTRSAGTGFVIASTGLIATNAHVIEGADQITVRLGRDKPLTATVVGSDPSDDLGVIRVRRTGLVPLEFASSDQLRVGAIAIAIGNALALSGGPTASLGIISASGRNVTASNGTVYRDLVQTDAAINSGDSGGPLLGASGKVLGINTAVISGAQNIGFAISAVRAAPILKRLERS